MVIEKAREENERQNARNGPDRFMPTQEPDWNPNSDGEIRLLIPESKAIEVRVFMLQDSSKEEQIPEAVDNAVTPLVWASEVPGRSKLAEPAKVTLKPGAKPVRQNQYPIKWEARKGLEGLITEFLEYGLLVECESEYNTPILPVKKSGGKEYRLVQDLRAINQIVQDIHPVVANPYTLLTSLKEEHKWFTVLELKDAFFCIPLDTKSQSIFAFEWESPATGRKTQLTWTVLPQGFKNSPTLFGNQLAKELEMWKKQNQGEGILLQYVDDILIAAESKETCFEMTISLLNFLGQGGYRVSRNKAQIGKEAVIYLGFEISQGQRQLGNERKEAICQIPEPNSPKELKAFLGMIGWCRLWILNYGLYVKPLYEALKESKDQYLTWTPECHKSFKELRKALMMAPALGLPDLTKPFELFVHERQHLALGVLAQRLGPWKRPVGYFSKQLDTVSKGWPGCLRAVAATVLLIQEARKLTMGQKIVVYVPHMVITVLEQKGGHWLSPSRMLKYQVVLLEQDDVELKTTAIVNPAMFLSTENPTEKLEHDCLLTIEQVYSSRPDLKDEPLKDPDLELFMDGSSFVQEGRRMAGYAVVTTDKVLESGTLPANTSAQKAELVALKQALRMAEGKRANIWKDSKYAFSVIHAHGAIWKERGLLSAQGSPIRHKEEVLQLLQDVQKPKEVAVMHCKAHQFGQTLHIPPENAWRAQICLLTEKNPTEEGDIPDEVLDAVIPIAWSSGTPGRAKNVTPVKIQLKPGAQPVRKKQYPIKLEARKGLFGSALAKELEQWHSEYNTITLLQYVDGLLIGSDTNEECLEATISLLNFLALAGYRVSKKKAQIGKERDLKL
ncbi:protein NYNRIN-like [Grus japonensis]|uniref:ribonuclease H n=1 Tax=Grus japonensis TaxID=30415 RepID=A0ABC9YD61_GRUJA